MPYMINYANDETRSAGDVAYETLAGSKAAFRAMMRSHPRAEMWLYQTRQNFRAVKLMHYDPHSDATVWVAPPVR